MLAVPARMPTRLEMLLSRFGYLDTGEEMNVYDHFLFPAVFKVLGGMFVAPLCALVLDCAFQSLCDSKYDFSRMFPTLLHFCWSQTCSRNFCQESCFYPRLCFPLLENGFWMGSNS